MQVRAGWRRKYSLSTGREEWSLFAVLSGPRQNVRHSLHTSDIHFYIAEKTYSRKLELCHFYFFPCFCSTSPQIRARRPEKWNPTTWQDLQVGQVPVRSGNFHLVLLLVAGGFHLWGQCLILAFNSASIGPLLQEKSPRKVLGTLRITMVILVVVSCLLCVQGGGLEIWRLYATWGRYFLYYREQVTGGSFVPFYLIPTMNIENLQKKL